jgi:hypothetical protein
MFFAQQNLYIQVSKMKANEGKTKNKIHFLTKKKAYMGSCMPLPNRKDIKISLSSIGRIQ